MLETQNEKLKMGSDPGEESSRNTLIAMLEVLLSEMKVEEKKDILEKEYGMVMQVETEGRMQRHFAYGSRRRGQRILLHFVRKSWKTKQRIVCKASATVIALMALQHEQRGIIHEHSDMSRPLIGYRLILF